MIIAAACVIPATGPAAALRPGYVAWSAGRITAVGAGPPPRPPDLRLPTGVLVPGLIDLQVNGYFGVDLAAADPAGWALVRRRLPETGTTAFRPTFITAPLPALAAALRRSAPVPGWHGAAQAVPGRGDVAPGRPACTDGARMLGIHVEGPFIARRWRGAHNPDWITNPDPVAVATLIAAGGGRLAAVTLAPERPGGLAAVRQLAEAGVLVSIGHSGAAAARVIRAADHGARMVTHLFNAQRPLHHREPGVTGTALADPRLTSGLIADGHHVSAAMCRIALAAAPGRICLVTDAASCAGMPPGGYQLGGEPIELPPGAGQPPVRPDGRLAGSALRMDAAVATMVAAGADLADAVAAATAVPADLAGCPDLGRLVPGAAADLTWLDDDLAARATWIAGVQVHPGDPLPPAGGPASVTARP